MTAAELERQAMVFVEMYDRRATGSWSEAFERWAGDDGKGFAPDDAWIIRQTVEAEMMSRGVIIPSLDYVPPEEIKT